MFGVQAALWRALGLDDLVVWDTASAWDLLKVTQLPSGSTPNLNVTLMQNEFRAVAFNVSNTTDTDLAVNVQITGLSGGTNPSYVAVHEVAWLDAETGEATATPLPNAVLGGSGYVIDVPVGMTRQVWLTFNPTTTSPGNYNGTVIVDGGAAGTVNVPIAMRLSSLVFPDQATLGLYTWDNTHILPCYDVTATNVNAYIAELNEHFVDSIDASSAVMPISVNFTPFDTWVARWENAAGREARNYCICLNVGSQYFPTSFGGYEMGTPEFNQAVGAWVSTYATHWTDVFTATDRKGGVEEIPLPPVRARYVRLWCGEQEMSRGVSLAEFEVHGSGWPTMKPNVVPPPAKDGTWDLCAGWKLYSQSFVTDDAAKVSTSGYDDGKWLVATVPGTVLTAYQNLGAVPDMFYGDQQLQVSDWFCRGSWWYRTEVDLPESYRGKRVWLNFDGKTELRNHSDRQRSGTLWGMIGTNRFEKRVTLGRNHGRVFQVATVYGSAARRLSPSACMARMTSGGTLGLRS